MALVSSSASLSPVAQGLVRAALPVAFYGARNVLTSVRSRLAHTHAVSAAEQDKFDQAYAAIFVRNFKVAPPLPCDITTQRVLETLEAYGKVGVSRKDAMYLFKDNVKWNLDRMSSAQLSGVSWALFQLGEESTELQAKILAQALRRSQQFTQEEMQKIKYVSLTTQRDMKGLLGAALGHAPVNQVASSL
eukprot:comp16994_c0_seq1/m.15664 comp16994_c0_seq1/g.15664  ORF comp16994_c0_seq1/g.15664 comp16994_c0_seq1/m.15664 type:complete len:190 (-) comp16994_c0_seq1:423-992(-)